MVPSEYFPLSAIPRAANGKIDRRALLAMGRPDRPTHVPPSTETERKIALIWTELLSVEQVGLEDDFFEFGGHSLLAARMLARVNSQFDTNLQLRAVFELRSIGRLASAVDRAQATLAVPPIARAFRRPVVIRIPASSSSSAVDKEVHDVG
jgi:acyl carrier protein